MPELNRIAAEGLLVIHKEEFTTPEISRSTGKSIRSPGNGQISAISPSEPLETYMTGSKRSNSIQDEIAETARKNVTCWCKDTDGNRFTTDATEGCSPLPMQIVEAHILPCAIVLLLQMDKCVIRELGNRSRHTYIHKFATDEVAIAQREGGSLICGSETEEGGAFRAARNW